MALTPSEAPRVASPCTGVCRMDPDTGWCLGCRRTIDEIVAWASLDDAARRQVWIALKQRRAAAAAAATDPKDPTP